MCESPCPQQKSFKGLPDCNPSSQPKSCDPSAIKRRVSTQAASSNTASHERFRATTSAVPSFCVSRLGESSNTEKPLLLPCPVALKTKTKSRKKYSSSSHSLKNRVVLVKRSAKDIPYIADIVWLGTRGKKKAMHISHEPQLFIPRRNPSQHISHMYALC